MPSRKTEHIVQVLRDEILSGRRPPGGKLPTYDQLMEQLGVTRPTIAKAMRALRGQGLLAPSSRPGSSRGLFVARAFPHRSRFVWVTSARPGSPDWTGLQAAMLDLIARGETGIPGEVMALVGVDGRPDNPAYRSLCQVVAQGAAAGLVVVGSPAAAALPVLGAPGLPRAAITAPVPHAALVTLDEDGLTERACACLRRGAGRVAVFSPHAAHLERTRERGAATVHAGPVGCDVIADLMFQRGDGPDAVFLADESLLAPFLTGLARAQVRPGRDLRLLARCAWPAAAEAPAGVERIGFDAREVLSAARACIDAQRTGDAAAGRIVRARFEHEWVSARPARPLSRAA